MPKKSVSRRWRGGEITEDILNKQKKIITNIQSDLNLSDDAVIQSILTTVNDKYNTNGDEKIFINVIPSLVITKYILDNIYNKNPTPVLLYASAVLLEYATYNYKAITEGEEIKGLEELGNYLKTTSSAPGGGFKGGNGSLDSAKIYNTQGLIQDLKSTFDNAVITNTTMIPKPFSSSGYAGYASSIDLSVPDVLKANIAPNMMS